MMRRNLFLLLLVLYAQRGFSQSVRNPISSTYIGLGAYSTDGQDVFSFTANQAALAKLTKPAVGVFGERRYMLAATSMYTAVLALPTLQGNFGVQADYFGFSNYNESQLGLAYARSLGPKVDLGIKFNYYGYRIAGYGNSSTFNFELGAITHLAEKLNAGIHLYNPVGGKFGKDRTEKIASIYKLGLGYEPSSTFYITAEVVKEEDQPTSINAGVQYSFAKQFFARGGVVSATNSFFAGAGLSWNIYRLDVTASYHPHLGFSPGVVLILSLKK